ncbi:MAG: hypothetical protein AB7O54_00790 [Pseudomonadales bacterium]
MTYAKDRGHTPLELNLREFDRLLSARVEMKRREMERMRKEGRGRTEFAEIVDNQLYQLEWVQKELDRLVGPWL